MATSTLVRRPTFPSGTRRPESPGPPLLRPSCRPDTSPIAGARRLRSGRSLSWPFSPGSCCRRRVARRKVRRVQTQRHTRGATGRSRGSMFRRQVEATSHIRAPVADKDVSRRRSSSRVNRPVGRFEVEFYRTLPAIGIHEKRAHWSSRSTGPAEAVAARRFHPQHVSTEVAEHHRGERCTDEARRLYHSDAVNGPRRPPGGHARCDYTSLRKFLFRLPYDNCSGTFPPLATERLALRVELSVAGARRRFRRISHPAVHRWIGRSEGSPRTRTSGMSSFISAVR